MNFTKTEQEIISIIYGQPKRFREPEEVITTLRAFIDERIKAAMPKQKYLVQIEETLFVLMHPNWPELSRSERDLKLNELEDKLKDALSADSSTTTILNVFRYYGLHDKDLGKLSITPIHGEIVKTEIV